MCISEVSISLSSGFSFQVLDFSSGVHHCTEHVSISLSSGFSFQADATDSPRSLPAVAWFQSRYRAASHFRPHREEVLGETSSSSFNLVIERLLISGVNYPARDSHLKPFQSRYRAASHFRWILRSRGEPSIYSFNLVIERLLISGCWLPSVHCAY